MRQWMHAMEDERTSLNARRWLALSLMPDRWSRVDGNYGVSHWIEYEENGNPAAEHDTIEGLADSLIEADGPHRAPAMTRQHAAPRPPHAGTEESG